MRRPRLDLDVVRRTGYDEFEPITSPVELARQGSTTVGGTVAGWAAGASVVDGDEREEFAVLMIAVAAARGPAAQVENGYVYVSVPRGGQVIASDGTPFRNPGAGSTVTSIAELARAVPVGTRLIFLGGGVTRPGRGGVDPGSVVGHAERGHPAGADVLVPGPQSLILEQQDGSFASALTDGERSWHWTSPQVRAEDRFGDVARQLSLTLPE